MAIVKRKRAEDAAKLEAEKEAEATRFIKPKDRGKKMDKKKQKMDRQANGHSQGNGVFKVPSQVPLRPKGVGKQAQSPQKDKSATQQTGLKSYNDPPSGSKSEDSPPPGFKGDIAPPPGFKADVQPPPGFKGDVQPPPGFKGDVEPPPGFKMDVSPPPGFKRKAEEPEDESQTKKAKIAEEYGLLTDKGDEDDLCTVFISNLEFSVDKNDIIPLFKECGEIKDFRLVRDFKLRSKGYGYLVFKTQDAVKKALEKDRIQLNSRPVYVSKYDPEGSDYNFKYTTDLEKHKLFVRGLPFDMTSDDVKEAFLPHGEIKELRLVSYRNGYSKGTCYIDYHSEEVADKVRQAMDGKELRGKVISVMVSNPPMKDKQGNPKPIAKEVTLGGGSKGKSTPGVRKKGMFNLVPRSLMRASSSSAKNDQTADDAPDSKPNPSEDAPAAKPKSNEDFRKMFLK